MHELRKDPLLSRWAVVLEKSLAPEEYASFSTARKGHYHFGPPGLSASGRAGQYVTVEHGSGGIRVVKGIPLLNEEGGLGRKAEGIYDKMNPIGVHELVLDHGPGNYRAVLDVYLKRISALVKDLRLRYVFIFRDMEEGPWADRHAAGGGETEHLHSEILATPVIPDLVKRELDGAKQYYQYKERCIFCDMIDEEARAGSRVIARTEHFIAFSPYAPRMPFEFWIVPLRHSCAFEDINAPELDSLGRLLPDLLERTGRALHNPPCRYCIHTAPNRIPRKNLWHTLGDDYHWHIEVLPGMCQVSAMDCGFGFSILTTSPEDAARCIRED